MISWIWTGTHTVQNCTPSVLRVAKAGCIVIDKRDDKILDEKLLGLFKAIYTKDPELKNISNDAFQ